MNQQIIHSIIDTIKYKYLLNNREHDQNNIGEIVIISLIFIVISYISTNVSRFEKISEKLSDLFVYKRLNSILLEGKRCFRITDYNTRSDQLFSNRFKAIWYYLAKNNNSDSLNNNRNNNDTIYSIKEFADSSNIYDEQGDAYTSNRSNRNQNQNQKRLLDMYVVNQQTQFIISNNIFCKVSIKNDIINGKSHKKTDDSNSSKIEIINLEIFSYIKSLDEIKEFIDKITLEFMSEIHNTRLNKKFIYTLLGKPSATKYDDEPLANRYSDWEECEFKSSRRFDNLFFEDKAEIIAKIRFFNDNRDWYEAEGHPWTFGLGLSGPPGTGKTSIIKCIANMLNRHIIVIPLNKIKTQREFSQYYFENRYNVNNASDSITFDNKIIVLPIGQDYDVLNYINQNNLHSDLIIVGFNKQGFKDAKTFDEGFYNTVNLPFEYRFTKFKFDRNTDKESEVYNELNPNNEPYIYVHDDPQRGFKIDRNKLNSNLKIIENDKRFLMIDMLKIIENAEEVHLMESSIKNLVNSYKMEKPKFFYHKYVRGYPEWNNTKSLNKFQIIH